MSLIKGRNREFENWTWSQRFNLRTNLSVLRKVFLLVLFSQLVVAGFDMLNVAFLCTSMLPLIRNCLIVRLMISRWRCYQHVSRDVRIQPRM